MEKKQTPGNKEPNDPHSQSAFEVDREPSPHQEEASTDDESDELPFDLPRD